MLVPKEFAAKDQQQLLAFIRRNPFATVICPAEAGRAELAIVKIPLKAVEKDGGLVLEGHMAAIGPVAKALAADPSPTATIMFDGAHDYISARWYADQVLNVPTWNYSTAVCEAECRLIRDPEWLRDSVLALTRQFEPDDQWEQSVDRRFVSKLTKAIVGIEAKVTSITGQFKLSQNKSPTDRKSVVRHLEERGNHALADDMRLWTNGS